MVCGTKFNKYEDYGFAMAPLYYRFVEWAAPQTKGNVYASMRGAKPIICAAHEMARIGVTDTSDWQELWVNRTIADKLADHRTVNYLEQIGIDKKTPFTLVDNGYKGQIPYAFEVHGYKKLKALFVAKLASAHSSVNALFTSSDIRQKLNRSLFNLSGPLIEGIPTETVEYYYLEKNQDGKLGPETLPKINKLEHDNFYKGFKDGINCCAEKDQKQSNEQFWSYLNDLYMQTT